MTIAQVTFLAVLVPAFAMIIFLSVVRLRRGDWEARRDVPTFFLILGIAVGVGLVFFLPPLAIGVVAGTGLTAGGLWLINATLPPSVGVLGRAAGWLALVSGLLMLVDTVAVLVLGRQPGS